MKAASRDTIIRLSLQGRRALPEAEAPWVDLVRHPDGECRGVDAIAVAVIREGPGTLVLAYRLAGACSALRIPAPAAASRRDGLWRHTCFEAFVAPASGPVYAEFNLSPSGEWAAYRFEAYRDGMAALEVPVPRIRARKGPDALELRARLSLPAWLCSGPLRLGVSAVVEDACGRFDYWALRHPATAPDFHHTEGFALEF